MTRNVLLCFAIVTVTGLACVLILPQSWFGLLGRGKLESRTGTHGASPEVVWTFEPPERGGIASSPLVAGERIYLSVIHDAGLATYGRVYCLDRRTGKPIWNFDNDGRMLHMYSSPCLAEGRLYVGEGMHQNFSCKFYCLDANTGNELWHFQTAGHIESSPCVGEGRVFFGAGDEGLYCLDAVSGAQRWNFRGDIHVDTSPQVVGQRVYAGSGTSRLHKSTEIFCLDAASGAEVWRKRTELPVWGSPAVAGDAAFFGLGNGRLLEPPAPPDRPAGALLCVDARSGTERWRFTGSDAVFCRPALDEAHVYFGARDHFCYCLDRDRGQLAWKVDMRSPVVARPVLADARLYAVSSGGLVQCLDAGQGLVLWTFDLAAHSRTRPQIFSSPSVIRAEGMDGHHHLLYVGSELSNSVSSAAVLYCLRD
jgi:outer membrane protein assembly factor BamB